MMWADSVMVQGLNAKQNQIVQELERRQEIKDLLAYVKLVTNRDDLEGNSK